MSDDLKGAEMGFTISKGRSEPSVNLGRVLCIVLFAVVLLLLGVVLTVVDPVRMLSKYNAKVDYNTFTEEALRREIKGVHLSAYLFNVTNAERFRAGLDSKLKMEEVGPFTYQEIRKNEKLEINPVEDFMRYAPRIRAKFLPHESIGRPEDFNVTQPNLVMLSMASKMGTYSLIPRLGFNLLQARVQSKAIVQATAQEFLWGYNEPLIKLGNELLPGWINFDKMGILDRVYDKKHLYEYEVRASDDSKFSIRSVDGSRGLDPWGYKDPSKRTKCNTFTDVYEGISYPSEMTSDVAVRIYRSILCRFLDLDYHGTKRSYKGIQGLEYKISNRTFTRNKDTECLCANGICQDGISDLSPCFLGLPVVLSNAHFLDADPKLYDRIDGMKPDEEQHGSSFVIEPIIGMAMETKFSVQVNLYMRDVRYNSETRPYSDMIIPVAYFKLVQPIITDEQLHSLDLMYLVCPAFILGFQTVLLIVSFVLLSYSAILMYCHWKRPSRTMNNNMHSFVCVKASAELPLMR